MAPPARTPLLRLFMATGRKQLLGNGKHLPLEQPQTNGNQTVKQLQEEAARSQRFETVSLLFRYRLDRFTVRTDRKHREFQSGA